MQVRILSTPPEDMANLQRCIGCGKIQAGICTVCNQCTACCEGDCCGMPDDDEEEDYDTLMLL